MKHTRKQRLFALVLALVLVFEVLPLGAFATNGGSADFELADDSVFMDAELEAPTFPWTLSGLVFWLQYI